MFHVIILDYGFHDQNKVIYCAMEDTVVVATICLIRYSILPTVS